MRSPATLACVLLVAAPARADWPVGRHDPARTATGSATPAPIHKPAPFWRYYLGGALTRRGYLATDVNGDGKVEVVYIAGGKLIAKLPDDTLVWESPPVEIHTLVGVDDLDGDGTRDVVAFGDRKALVLSGKTGQVEWEEPDGEMGTVGGVRLGDLDGDGKPDLFIDECGCCGVNNGSPGVSWRFAKGFANAKPAWTSPAHAHCGAAGDTLGDFDGDGKLDLGYSSEAAVQMVRGRDGMSLGTSAPTGNRGDAAVCDAANVDGRPGDEMICFEDIYQAGGNLGARQVFAVTYDGSASPPVRILWQHAIANVAGGRMVHAGASVSDLDGDGKLEVAVSDFDGAAWTLRVYDAATGTELGRVGGSVLASVVDVTGDGVPELLANAGNDLHAYRFKRGGTPAVSDYWSIAGGGGALSALEQVDWLRARRSGNDARALAPDLDGDGAPDPIVLVPAHNGKPASLTAFDAKAQGAPTPLASFSIPDGVALLAWETFPSVNRPYEQLLLTRNDGFLVILDDHLMATNALSQGEFPVPGMRVGGYYSGAYGPGAVPIAPHVDATGSDTVIVGDSRGALVRLDPRGASLITAPQLVWELLGAAQPSTVPKLDGASPGIACYQGGRLAALKLDGTPLWSAPLPASSPYGDPLPGDVNGDGTGDLFTSSIDGTGTLYFQVFDGRTGAPLWKSAVREALQWGFTPFSVGDWNRDGRADLFGVLNTLRVHDGASGAVLAQNGNFLAYFQPVIADVDGDGTDEVTMTGGYYPARTFAHDLNTTRWSGPDDRPYPYGARAVCTVAGAPRSVWVQTGLQDPGQVRISVMSGAQAGTTTLTAWLAGGAAFADAASARAAGARPGTVGNVTIKSGLAAADHPSALAGSTDGHLYALDPCATTAAALVDWSYDLRFPVGEAVFADTSGDGIDEILVTAADGYLYDIAQQIVAAPDHVYDTDPPDGITMQDVDTISTHDALYAAWGAVDAADSYEVAVITPGGSYVTQPNWQNVGHVTSTELDGLPLLEGHRYLFAVRAIENGKGASTEALSNGVTVHIVDRPVLDLSTAGGAGDGGGGGLDAGEELAQSRGCGCRIGSARGRRSGSAGALALLVFALVAAGRIARRRRG